MRVPYRYFPVITKDIGAGWQDRQTLPEGDQYVLICGGKWWETDAVLRAAKTLKTRGPVILLWNHVAKDIVPKLPAELSAVSCFSVPFFVNPFKADKAADACFRELYEAITGEEKGWKRKKRNRFWNKKQD